MKKFMFLTLVACCVSLFATAQSASCCKGSTKSCSKSTASAQAPASSEAIAKAVNMDSSVEARTEGDNTYYVRKDVCAQSGKVSYNKVEYCSKEGKFINMGPSEANGSKASCSSKAAGCSKEKAACCSKKGSTVEATSAPSKMVRNSSN